MANEFKVKNGLIVSGSADFEQDLRVRGTLTVDEFHTSIVSSSILYESGSTKFGDSSEDNHDFTGSVNISGSISLNGEPIGTGKLDESVFNGFTSSLDIRLNDIEGATASLYSLTASAIGRLSSLENTTGSIISEYNGYTSSTNIRLNAIEISTGSLNSFSSSTLSRLTSLESESSSIRSDFNSYTSSANGTDSTQNSRLTSLENTTGSLNTFSSSTISRLNSIEGTTGSLNSFTSSTNTRLNSIESTTSSLNTFTSSTNGRLNSIETSTGSLNTFSSSTNTRLNSIESTTGSLNSFSSSINSFTTSYYTVSSSINGRLTTLETYSGSYTGSFSGSINGRGLFDYITFNSSSVPTLPPSYSLWVNTTDKTLNLQMGNNAINQIGQEMYYPPVVNKSGEDLQDGTLVMVNPSGIAQGNRISVVKAIADGTYPADTIVGVLTEDVAKNQEGFATWFGYVRDIPKTQVEPAGETWLEGDILYPHPTIAGKLTKNLPTAPNLKSTIAVVTSINGTNVTLMVRPTLRGQLDTLHNVQLTGKTNGDLLTYYNGVWINSHHLNGDYSLTGSLNVTGSITLNGQTIGTGKLDESVFNSYTASNNTTNNTQNNRLTSLENSTGSLNTFSSSTNTRLSSIESTTGSLNSFTSSTNGILSSLESESSSIRNDFNSYTSSNDSTNSTQNNRLDSLETSTSSLNTFSSSTDTRLSSIEGKTGSFATTGPNTFNGNQTITGSLVVTQNLTVLGSSSIIYTTASNLQVDSNLIYLNAASPAQRFAGVAVYDSGSSNTGSLLWDSLNNGWIYTRESGSTYRGGALISGPRNTTGIIGNEQTTIANVIQKGQGGDHITGSNITDDGTNVIVNSNTIITGSLIVTSTISSTNITEIESTTSSLNSFTSSIINNLDAIHTSTSSLNSYTSSNNTRINTIESTTSSLNSYTSSNNTRLNSIESTTGSLNSFTSSTNTIIGTLQTATSSLNSYTSSNNTRLNAIETSTSSLNSFTSSINTTIKNKLNSDVVMSGSYLGNATTSNLTEGANLYYLDSRVKTKMNSDGVLSGSAQVVSSLPSGTVSGSIQINHNATTNYVANEHINHTSVSISAGNGLSGGGDISATRTLTLDTGSAHFTSGVKSKMNTDGVVSGSIQINHNATTNYDSNQHVDHTLVSVSAGSGLSGGGTIAATRTLTLDTGSAHFTSGVRTQLSFTAGSGGYSSSTGVITIPTNTNQLTNGAGYITSYTETDTLSTVTSRGATTSATITAERYRGNNSLTLNSYTTVNPSSNVFLYSQANDRDSWLYLDSADTSSNWGIYHRQIDSTVSGLEGNSIGFIGGGASALKAYIGLSTGNGYFSGTLTVAGNILPSTNNSSNLGSPSLGWANVYTNDLHLSNMNKPEGNDIDGTSGTWTIQEGAENLYIINNLNGKKYKIKLEEI